MSSDYSVAKDEKFSEINVDSLNVNGLKFPTVDGTPGQVMTTDGNGNLLFATVVAGDVVGPNIAVDNAVARFNGTTGKLIQNSGVTISDSGVITASNIVTSSGLTFPTTDGTSGQAIVTNGSGVLSFATLGTGNVVGPNTSVDNAVARFDGTTGKLIQNSGVTISDSGVITASNIVTSGFQFPAADGTAGQGLVTNGSGVLSFATVGNTIGATSSVDNALARFDGTTGKIIQNSTAILDDTGKLITTNLQVGNINYANTDGTVGQVLRTNGSGLLTFTIPSPPRIFANLANSQTTNIADGDHIKFDTVVFNSASNNTSIVMDTTTAYTNAPNVASIGRFTLRAGRKYMARFSLGSISWTNNTGQLGFRIYNSDSNAPISPFANMYQTPTPGQGVNITSMTWPLSPVSDTRYEVQINNGVVFQAIVNMNIDIIQIE